MFIVIENNKVVGKFNDKKQAEVEAAWIAHLSGNNAVVVKEWTFNKIK